MNALTVLITPYSGAIEREELALSVERLTVPVWLFMLRHAAGDGGLQQLLGEQGNPGQRKGARSEVGGTCWIAGW